MNIRQDIKELKTGTRELRNFGLLVGGVFAVLGAWFWFRQKGYYGYFIWPGALMMVFGTVFPRALRHIYIAWMTLAFVLGFIVAHVILTVFFFLILTPIGLLARIFGKDFLGLKQDQAATTYWIRREQKPKAPEEYERQF